MRLAVSYFSISISQINAIVCLDNSLGKRERTDKICRISTLGIYVKKHDDLSCIGSFICLPKNTFKAIAEWMNPRRFASSTETSRSTLYPVIFPCNPLISLKFTGGCSPKIFKISSSSKWLH